MLSLVQKPVSRSLYSGYLPSFLTDREIQELHTLTP